MTDDVSASENVTTGPALMERCFETTVRVDEIIHLASMTVDMDSDLAEKLLDDYSSAFAEALGMTEEETKAISVSDLREEVGWLLRNRAGWIVDVATPVMTKSGTKGVRSFSWGYYTSKAFYGETYEEALERGFKWAEELPPREP